MSILSRKGPSGKAGKKKAADEQRRLAKESSAKLFKAGEGLVEGSVGNDSQTTLALRKAIQLAYETAGSHLSINMGFWAPIQLKVNYQISSWVDKRAQIHDSADKMNEEKKKLDGEEKAKRDRVEKHLTKLRKKGASKEELEKLRAELEEGIKTWRKEIEHGPIAYTDGRTAFFGARYIVDLKPPSGMEIDDDEKHISLGDHAFVLIHELLHCALEHIPRTRRAMERSGVYNSSEIMNVTADAYINEIIRETGDGSVSVGIMEIPENCVTKETIARIAMEMTQKADPKVLKKLGFPKGLDLSQAKQKGVLIPDRIHEEGLQARKRPFLMPAAVYNGEIEHYDFVELHDLLMKLYVLHAEDIKVQYIQSQSGGHCIPGSGGGDSDELPDKARPYKLPEGEHMRDLNMDDSEESPEQSDREMRETGEKMREAMRQVSQTAGSEGAKVLQSVRKRLNRKPAWWNRMKPFLHSHMTTDPQEDHQRPSRQFVSAWATGQDTAYSPGINYYTPAGAVAICVDTSGSISNNELETFGKHLFAIAELTNCRVHVVAGDVKPVNVYENAEMDVLTENKLQLGGRGGTEFQPLIKEAMKFAPDAIVYLTDGYAEFGKSPGIPFLWVITQNGIELQNIPWGQRVKIEKHDE